MKKLVVLATLAISYVSRAVGSSEFPSYAPFKYPCNEKWEKGKLYHHEMILDKEEIIKCPFNVECPEAIFKERFCRNENGAWEATIKKNKKGFYYPGPSQSSEWKDLEKHLKKQKKDHKKWKEENKKWKKHYQENKKGLKHC